MSLTVNRDTKLSDVKQFADGLAGGEKLHAKYNKSTDSYTLYAAKGGGTGLKNFLFGTNAKRESNVRAALNKAMFNVPLADRPRTGGVSALGVALSKALSGLPTAANIQKSDIQSLVSTVSRAFDRANLPGGTSVDQHGNLSGTVNLVAKNVRGQAPVNIKTAVQDGVDRRLQEKDNKGKVGALPFQNVGGTKVHPEFLADALRMNFTIGGTQTNVHSVSSTEGRKNAELAVTQNLRQFAGSDNATKVLSALCHQGTFNNFVSTIARGDGEPIDFRPPQKGSTVGSGNGMFKDSGGTVTDVGVPGQYTGVDMKLAKYSNGDFKMTITWDNYFSKIQDHEGAMHELNPSDPSRVAKMTTTFEIRVDAQAAANGQLQFSFEVPPKATFSGNIA